MAQKRVEIALSTSGASRTRGDLQDVEQALNNIGNAAQNAGHRTSFLGDVIKATLISHAVMSGLRTTRDLITGLAQDAVQSVGDMERLSSTIQIAAARELRANTAIEERISLGKQVKGLTKSEQAELTKLTEKFGQLEDKIWHRNEVERDLNKLLMERHLVHNYYGDSPKYFTHLDKIASKQRELAETDAEIAKMQERINELRNKQVSYEVYDTVSKYTMGLEEAYEKSGDIAQGYIDRIKQLTLTRPVVEKDLMSIFQVLTGYQVGVGTDAGIVETSMQLTEGMANFGLIAGRSSEDIYRMSIALAQVNAKGKLMAEEMRQFTNAGLGVVDIVTALNDKYPDLGITVENFQEKMKGGSIKAEYFITAMMDYFNQFDTLGGKLAKTWYGIPILLKNVKRVVNREFFQGVLKEIKKPFSEFIDLFDVQKHPNTLIGIKAIGDAFGAFIRPAMDWLAGPAIDSLNRFFIGLTHGQGVIQKLVNGVTNALGWGMANWDLESLTKRFWRWITDDDGVLPQVGKYIGAVVTSMYQWLAAKFIVLKSLASTFWTNLVSNGGIIDQGGQHLGSIIKVITDFLSKQENWQDGFVSIRDTFTNLWNDVVWGRETTGVPGGTGGRRSGGLASMTSEFARALNVSWIANVKPEAARLGTLLWDWIYGDQKGTHPGAIQLAGKFVGDILSSIKTFFLLKPNSAVGKLLGGVLGGAIAVSLTGPILGPLGAMIGAQIGGEIFGGITAWLKEGAGAEIINVLNQLATSLNNSVKNNTVVRAEINKIGHEVGRGIIEGIKALFSGQAPEEAATHSIWFDLGAALGRTVTAVDEAVATAAVEFAAGLVSEIAQEVGIKLPDGLSTGIKNALITFGANIFSNNPVMAAIKFVAQQMALALKESLGIELNNIPIIGGLFPKTKEGEQSISKQIQQNPVFGGIVIDPNAIANSLGLPSPQLPSIIGVKPTPEMNNWTQEQIKAYVDENNMRRAQGAIPLSPEEFKGMRSYLFGFTQPQGMGGLPMGKGMYSPLSQEPMLPLPVLPATNTGLSPELMGELEQTVAHLNDIYGIQLPYSISAFDSASTEATQNAIGGFTEVNSLLESLQGAQLPSMNFAMKILDNLSRTASLVMKMGFKDAGTTLMRLVEILFKVIQLLYAVKGGSLEALSGLKNLFGWQGGGGDGKGSGSSRNEGSGIYVDKEGKRWYTDRGPGPIGRMANGFNGIVPQGHPNDTFPFMAWVRSGEKIKVTPRGQQQAMGVMPKSFVNIEQVVVNNQMEAAILNGVIDRRIEQFMLG